MVVELRYAFFVNVTVRGEVAAVAAAIPDR